MKHCDLRPATLDDLAFLLHAIRATEHLETLAAVSMYEIIYGLSGFELDALLAECLSGDHEGHQLSLRSFLIAELDGMAVGCCARWVEGAGVKASGARVAMIVSRFIGIKRWRAQSDSVRAISDSSPPRTVGALQLESFYVDPNFRGDGIAGRLIEAAIRAVRPTDNMSKLAEISLLRENESAARAYRKVGFEPTGAPVEATTEFVKLTGSSGLLQLRKELGSG